MLFGGPPRSRLGYVQRSLRRDGGQSAARVYGNVWFAPSGLPVLAGGKGRGRVGLAGAVEAARLDNLVRLGMPHWASARPRKRRVGRARRGGGGLMENWGAKALYNRGVGDRVGHGCGC